MCCIENEAFDVILLMGQSNAEGMGLGDVECEYQANERVLMMIDTYPVGNKPDKDGNIYLDAKLPTEYRFEIAKEELNVKNEKIGNFALPLLAVAISLNSFDNICNSWILFAKANMPYLLANS